MVDFRLPEIIFLDILSILSIILSIIDFEWEVFLVGSKKLGKNIFDDR